MAKPLDDNATLVERVDFTDALSIFKILPDKLPKKRPWFKAGQYCVLGVHDVDNPPVRRPMSIASAPEVDGPIEFYIRRVAKPESPNPLTHLLWTLKSGDRLYMRTVAAGRFTIKDTVGVDDPRIRVMVASGTGLAPFVSMIRSEVRRNPHADLSKWVLLHGASFPTDLGYRHELLELSATNSLQYWGTVSRPQESPDWTGDVGRVESFFTPERLPELEQRLKLPPDGFSPGNAVVFVCGLTGTVAATLVPLIDRAFIPVGGELRTALGVPPEAAASLFFELYDAHPIIDITNPAAVESLRARLRAALATRAHGPTSAA
jgi:ferredoxin/flavodoxin---NADP+ reductase